MCNGKGTWGHASSPREAFPLLASVNLSVMTLPWPLSNPATTPHNTHAQLASTTNGQHHDGRHLRVLHTNDAAGEGGSLDAVRGAAPFPHHLLCRPYQWELPRLCPVAGQDAERPGVGDAGEEGGHGAGRVCVSCRGLRNGKAKKYHINIVFSTPPTRHPSPTSPSF